MNDNQQKRPSFQFYPYDWKSDLKLRRCSPAARGVWMDVLCAFHDSDDGYGFLRWPLKEIASTVGASMAHVRELVDKGVLRGSDKEIVEPLVHVPRSGRKNGDPVTLIPTQAGPLWYSKRMVKDEYVRTIRGESSRFGGTDGDAPKASPKDAPKPPLGEVKSDGSSTSSSASQRERASEADASAAAASPPPPDPKPPTARERVFTLGVGLLGEKGRSYLAKLAAAHGDDVLADVLAEAVLDRPVDPKSWVTAACEARTKARGERNGVHVPDLLAGETRPKWATDAGFADRFQAESAGCSPANYRKFSDGKRVQP